MINSPAQNAILIYMIIVLGLLIIKPRFMYDNKNRLKKFGFGESKTICTLPIICISSGVFFYFIFAIIDKLNA